MKQLTYGDIKSAIEEIKKENLSIDVDKIPIYLSDDEELNGIHSAFQWDVISPNNNPYSDVWIESRNCPLKKVSLLIA